MCDFLIVSGTDPIAKPDWNKVQSFALVTFNVELILEATAHPL